MGSQIHNEMAKFAYDTVVESAGNKEFRSLARAFPSMLQANGLGASVAFLFSKRNKVPHKILYEMLGEWTMNQWGEKERDLMERLTNLDSIGYRIYTDEVMKLCLWIKRFAEGMD